MLSYPNLSVIPLNCGKLHLERSRFSGIPNDSILDLPVFSFLIIHPKGCILFDTGLPPELWLGRSCMELIHGLVASCGSSGGLVKEIEAQGYSLHDLSVVVNSHYHVDHTGGNYLIPRDHYYVRHDINRDCDLFGDGSIHLLATPGHSPDHLSMLVRGRDGQVLLTGDACFRPANLIDLKLPLIVDNQEQALQSLKRLRDISEASGTMVLTSHDPTATGKSIVL